MRKICVYVGSRANYTSLKSALRAIQQHPQLMLQLVLGASAVLDRYGNIEQIVQDDGFSVDFKFHMVVEGENPTTMAKTTGLGIIEMALILSNIKPDILLVVGDRFDVMAPVIAGSYMNIPIAHTMGGEVSGTIDENIRHAITKLAHIHFPATEEAKQRILRMGEVPEKVFNVGCPRIDLVRESLDDPSGIAKNIFSTYKGIGEGFDIETEDFLIVAQHPVTTEYGANRKHVEETLLALKELEMPTIMIWPNVDAGSDELAKGIRTFREKNSVKWLNLFVNLPSHTFIYLMSKCVCMIGNSSSAVREGAFLGTPAVNVGTRQNGRQMGENTIQVSSGSHNILKAVRRQIAHGRYPSNGIYGNGGSGQAIANILAEIGPVPVQKKIGY